MEKRISSKHNQCIKTVRLLGRSKKFRKKCGLFVFEGIRLMEEALKADLSIEFVLISDKLDASREGKQLRNTVHKTVTDIFLVEHKLLLSAAQTENPQGIIAVAKQPDFTWNDLCLHKPDSFVLVVDGVQDPGNLGTIVRTADAAGAGGLILTAGTVDVYNGKVIRSAMGSLFRIPFLTDCLPEDAVTRLQENGLKILVAHVGSDSLFYDVNFEGPLAIVVGNENRGPHEAFLRAGTAVRVPCETESLNVSVAAAILLYERVRRNFC